MANTSKIYHVNDNLRNYTVQGYKRPTIAQHFGVIPYVLSDDINDPIINFTSHNDGFITKDEIITLSGTVTDESALSSVTFSSDVATGNISGTNFWQIPDLTLASGVNTITITAEDVYGNSSTQSIEIIRDVLDPGIDITSHSKAIYFTPYRLVTVSGTAYDNLGISSVTWETSDDQSGTASGTNNWVADGVPISDTGTVVTVTATDNSDRSVSDNVFAYKKNIEHRSEKITPPDAASSDQFGNSVAVNGSIVVVGSHYDDNDGTDSGSAYIFDTAGNYITKITAPDAAAGDRFGRSVSVYGSTIVVGAWYDDGGGNASGSAYIFDTSGNYITKITAPDAVAGDLFGSSVSVYEHNQDYGPRWCIWR